MLKLSFDTIEDYSEYFSTETPDRKLELTRAVVENITKGLEKKRKTVLIFEVELREIGETYEVSLPSSEWPTAIRQCLKHYEDLEMVDDIIDTYLLLQKIEK